MHTVGFIPECTPLSSVPPASAEEQGQHEEKQDQEEEQPKKGRVKNGDKR